MASALNERYQPRPNPVHRRGGFPTSTPRKEEPDISLSSQRVSNSQDEIDNLKHINIINVNNLVGTEAYGKVLAFGRL